MGCGVIKHTAILQHQLHAQQNLSRSHDQHPALTTRVKKHYRSISLVLKRTCITTALLIEGI